MRESYIDFLHCTSVSCSFLSTLLSFPSVWGLMLARSQDMFYHGSHEIRVRSRHQALLYIALAAGAFLSSAMQYYGQSQVMDVGVLGEFAMGYSAQTNFIQGSLRNYMFHSLLYCCRWRRDCR